MPEVRPSLLMACGWMLIVGCGSAPTGRYGVRDVTVQGTRHIAERAVLRCLLTRARPEVTITLGTPTDPCGEPPFTHSAPQLVLFRSPFADYQGFNPAVATQDARRIERFYQARGFREARVTAVRFDPPHAARSAQARPPDACDPRTDTCPVDVTFVVQEGEALRVGGVEVTGQAGLDPAERAALPTDAIPRPGERFDESEYDRGKAALSAVLVELGYGTAKVEGKILIDRDAGFAHLHYRLIPGPRYTVGEVRVTGQGDLPRAPILAAAGAAPGTRYRASLLSEVQQHVYALGAFSAVEVDPRFSPDTAGVDLEVRVSPLQKTTWRLGVGVMSGAPQPLDTHELASVPQWDVHLLLRHERRHLLGGLGRLRVEDRPRLVFRDPFPEAGRPGAGNVLQLRYDQPAVLERLTNLATSATWDVGPDRFLRFYRHDVELRTALSRPWFERRLLATLALQQDFYVLVSGDPTTPNYNHRFLEQDVRLDVRDASAEPRKGAYFGLLSRQSLRSPAADFTTFHIGGDARGYLPLPLSMVLAARVTSAFLFVSPDSPDPLGPANYRLRGGGANGNRGFVAGELGVGVEGGLRRIEGSLELRVRLGHNFGLALFGDAGDVRAHGPLDLGLPNPTLGFGLRYRTPIGPIRFDIGFRVGQTTGPQDGKDGELPLFNTPGAMHLTLGESF